jgi:hypothetical protein
MPPYRGHVDLAADRITGGHPGAPRFRELSLQKVPRADWPMVSARPVSRPGDPAYAWTPPADRDDGWRTASPADVGIDWAAIEGMVAAILAGEAGALHSILMARDGALVLEEYFHGSGAPRDTPRRGLPSWLWCHNESLRRLGGNPSVNRLVQPGSGPAHLTRDPDEQDAAG